MTTLAFARDLALPAESTLTQRLAFLGRPGSGKTYAAGKLVEELLGPDGTRAQVVIVDPVGTWFGLRLAAGGVRAGIPIPVLGGMHGDVPLEPTGGALVADLLVDTGQSMVLDVSEMSWAEVHKFTAAFATRLLARKKRQRSPLLTVWDEAQEFVPQHAQGKTVPLMLGAMQRLAKVGRNFGVGIALLSQRPQAVSKEVLNLTECLFVFQTTGPHERGALKKWVVEKGLDVALLEALPSLKPGDGLVWSPTWLETFQRVRALPKWTYDASATPTGTTAAARPLAPIDLDQVRNAMAATIEHAKANDPAELRRKIAALERELTAAKRAQPALEVQRIEVPILTDDQVQALDAAAKGVAGAVDRLHAMSIAELRQQIDRIVDVGGQLRDVAGAIARAAAPVMRPAPTPPRPQPRPPAPGRTPAPAQNGAGGGLEPGMHRILDTVAMLDVRGIGKDTEVVARWMGIHPNGGRYRTRLGALRAQGYLDGWTLTDRGRQVACLCVTGLEGAMAVLDEGQRRIVEAVVAEPAESTEVLAERLGLHPNGGRFRTNLGRLRTLGIVTPRAPIAPTPELFR